MLLRQLLKECKLLSLIRLAELLWDLLLLLRYLRLCLQEILLREMCHLLLLLLGKRQSVRLVHTDHLLELLQCRLLLLVSLLGLNWKRLRHRRWLLHGRRKGLLLPSG